MILWLCLYFTSPGFKVMARVRFRWVDQCGNSFHNDEDYTLFMSFWQNYRIGTAQKMSVDIDATPVLLLLIQQKLHIVQYRYGSLSELLTKVIFACFLASGLYIINTAVVTTLTTKPASVMAFGAHDSGICSTIHFQKRCMKGSKSETPVTLYLCSASRFSCERDNISLPILSTMFQSRRQQYHIKNLFTTRT